jgi:glycosyltransferase involved in cell wall biosynthesis
LRILVVHNYYGSSSPSGENAAVDSEVSMLSRRGHEVEVFRVSSDEIRERGLIGLWQGALSTPWSFSAARRFASMLSRFRANVVHVHNTFPLISPSVFWQARGLAARVMTLHNFRLYCAAGIPSRNGKVCLLCVERRNSIPAVAFGCYRDSSVATVPLAFNIELHRALGTWVDQVEGFIALTCFQKEKLTMGGLPVEKVYLKPNFFPGNPRVLSWSERDPCVVFAGRLSIEKGISSLVEAWVRWCAEADDAPELRVIGDGPLRARLEAAAYGVNIKFLGQLSAGATRAEIGKARLTVVPSECLEGFPMVIGESFALGTPVAVSSIGALPAIIEDGRSGIVFPVSDPSRMLSKVRNAWADEQLLERLGRAARAEFELKYNEDANYKMLMSIYDSALARLSVQL